MVFGCLYTENAYRTTISLDPQTAGRWQEGGGSDAKLELEANIGKADDDRIGTPPPTLRTRTGKAYDRMMSERCLA